MLINVLCVSENYHCLSPERRESPLSGIPNPNSIHDADCLLDETTNLLPSNLGIIIKVKRRAYGMRNFFHIR